MANAKKYAAEIAQDLLAAGVETVILTSTWGTCTRCGATMVVAIPHPLGNPALSREDEKEIRRKLVRKVLAALQTEVDGQTVFDE